MPPSTIDTIARARTAGFAWDATVRPTASILGRSLAPSPTAIARAGAHRRLGVVRDRQAHGLHHRQVVGAVADRDRLCRLDAEARAALQHRAALLVAVADVAPGLIDHAAGEGAAFDLEHVGAGFVDMQ